MVGRRQIRLLLVGAVVLVLVLCGCTHNKTTVARVVPPLLLAQLALGPADLDGAYLIASDQYVDEDGAPVAAPTREFERRFTAPSSTSDGRQPRPAVAILITLGDKGSDQAAEFVMAADDEDVGPANLADDLHQQVPDAHDVHVELLQDFETIGDATVAFRLSWLQGASGEEQAWRAYRVYVRSGGMLALVALRAQAEPSGSEPDGLRRQVEAIARKQADRLKSLQAPSAGVGR
jgi:hypothetical protein